MRTKHIFLLLTLTLLSLPATAQREWIQFAYREEPFDVTGRALIITAATTDVCMVMSGGDTWCLTGGLTVSEYLNGIGQNSGVNRGGIEQPLTFTQDGTPLVVFPANGSPPRLGSWSTGGAGFTLLVDSATGSPKAVISLGGASVSYGGSVLFTTRFTLFQQTLTIPLPPAGVPCPLDYNGDGSNDFFDMTAFLADYDAGSLDADVTDDGMLTTRDVQVLIGAIVQECGAIQLPIPGR
jgi:hypothetical protein